VVARSVWFSAPHQLELRDEALPAVGPDDVRVQTIASAISHGTEMLVFRGQVPPDLDLDLPTLRGSFGFPIKYGYASVGRVVETGAAVSNLERGETVFVHHPHQTEYVVPANMPVRLPHALDPTHGVFVANVETAVNVILDAAPRLGERVVIFGQGVVGLLLTQLLKRCGVSEVAVVDPVPRRRAVALRVGADCALDPTETLAGRDFDVAIEAWYGTKPVQVQLGGPFHRRRLRIVSSQVSTVDAALQPRWSRERRLDLARELLEQLKLDVLISHRLPFEQAAQAYQLVDEHPDETVQVVLTYA
jgi:2-desacetyl-2-hydroxyethyl bacteriochlorophyllide A dehydrogenase